MPPARLSLEKHVDNETLRGVKVMVIDDSNTIRRSAEIFLNQAGCEVDTQLIDLALVDLQLSPDMRNRDGLKLIEEIRANHKAVPSAYR